MNSFHEPSSQTMSKNRLRNSTESNRVENRSSAQPVASPHSQAARPAPSAPSTRLPPVRPARPRLACAPSVSTPNSVCARLRALHAQPRALPRAQLPSPCCIVTQAYPSSQYSFYCNTNLLPTKLYCNTVSSQASHLYCNTIAPLAIQFLPTNFTSLQYNLLYCNKISNPQASSLQYNDCIAIQFPVLLQYNWAVAHTNFTAHTNFCTNFFFCFSL